MKFSRMLAGLVIGTMLLGPLSSTVAAHDDLSLSGGGTVVADAEGAFSLTLDVVIGATQKRHPVTFNVAVGINLTGGAAQWATPPAQLTFTGYGSQSVTIGGQVPPGTPTGEYTLNVHATSPMVDNLDNGAPAHFTIKWTAPTLPPSPADTTAPVITFTVDGTQGANGWYTTDVSVTWSVTDSQSDITLSSGCGSSSVTSDTIGITFTCTATSTGGTGSASVTIKRDATKPVITFVGTTDYTVDQFVAITCAATDATSGVAAQLCPGANGEAYTFEIRTHTLSASATDNAGNDATAGFTFTVTVTADSLCNLTKRFATKTLGNSLCAQLNAAAAAGARGNVKAKANALEAYTREVNAQTGKAFGTEKAAILIRLAAHLTN